MGAGALPPTPSGSGNADVLRASQLRVPGRCLPGPAPVLGDELEVAVALRRRALRRLARHRTRARRHDDGRLGVALADAGVNTILIVRTVAGERGDRAVHLVQQGTNLGA